MFVSMKTITKIASAAFALTALSSVGATADDSNVLKKKRGTIPVTVELSNVQTAAGPIYISIQKADQYMGMKGFGGVIKTAVQGTMVETFNVDVPGDYAVSVWHDTNDNGVFDMDEQYRPLEGWGGSGDAPTDRKPTFDDVKLNVGHAGLTVPVTVKYGT